MESIHVSSDHFITIKTDVTSEESVNQAVKKIISEFSTIDVLIHIAGTYRGGKSIFEEDLNTYDFLMSLNVRSFVILSKAIVPIMKERQKGNIITIGSRNVLTLAPPFNGAYTASKSALVKLTETLAYELIDNNITVNSIIPSIIDTKINREAMPNKKYDEWVNPENIGHLMNYLINDHGKDVTGASIPVYGRVR